MGSKSDSSSGSLKRAVCHSFVLPEYVEEDQRNQINQASIIIFFLLKI